MKTLVKCIFESTVEEKENNEVKESKTKKNVATLL